MSSIEFTIDGKEVRGQPGQTILEAADRAGVYIPRLCNLRGLIPHRSCRVCTVLVNGRLVWGGDAPTGALPGRVALGDLDDPATALPARQVVVIALAGTRSIPGGVDLISARSRAAAFAVEVFG